MAPREVGGRPGTGAREAARPATPPHKAPPAALLKPPARGAAPGHVHRLQLPCLTAQPAAARGLRQHSCVAAGDAWPPHGPRHCPWRRSPPPDLRITSLHPCQLARRIRKSMIGFTCVPAECLGLWCLRGSARTAERPPRPRGRPSVLGAPGRWQHSKGWPVEPESLLHACKVYPCEEQSPGVVESWE